MKDELPANLGTWLSEAVADAARRGVPELEPLLRSLARSTAALRSAAWNDTIAARAPHVAAGTDAGATARDAGSTALHAPATAPDAATGNPHAGEPPEAGR